MSEIWIDVGSIADFPVASARPCSADGRTILVCHTDEGLYAIASRCTHVAWPLRDGPLEGCEIHCTLHGARFYVRSGEATQPPASKPLQTFDVRQHDGRVLVRA